MKYFLMLCLSIFTLINVTACQGSLSGDEVVIADNYVKYKRQYQKQGAALHLVNSQVNIVTAGVQYAIDLDIKSRYNSGNITLSVSASEGLYIVDGNINTERSLSKGSMSFPYVIIASEAGRYYIRAKAKVEEDNGKESFRALTMIVQVGEETSYEENTNTFQKNNANTIESTDTTIFEAPVSMPAEERIIH